MFTGGAGGVGGVGGVGGLGGAGGDGGGTKGGEGGPGGPTIGVTGVTGATGGDGGDGAAGVGKVATAGVNAPCGLAAICKVVGGTVWSTVLVVLEVCAVACWLGALAWMLALMLAEITLATPLRATVTSVGATGAPPLPPGRPSICARSAAVRPGGAGAGLEGAAPGPDTVTSNPGR
jgi:hypothetical protein